MKIRLLLTRLVGQCADGVFQTALFTAIAFNPERQATPLLTAASLAVLVGPYSLIGPLVGTLLDRWDRRLVLLWANVIRAFFMLATAILLAVGQPDAAVLAVALGVMGTSRFVAAGLSASIPHVTDRASLVSVNAMFNVLGGFAILTGVGLAAAARGVFGGGDTGVAKAMVIGALLAAAAGLLARTFPSRSLGPDHPTPANALAALVHGWRSGLTLVARTPSVATVLGAIGVNRWAGGMNALTMLVLVNHIGVGSGLQRFLLLAGATAAGALLAAATTPTIAGKIGRHQTLILALAVAVPAQLLVATFQLGVLIAAALVLGWIAQTIKLCGDVAMQLDIADEQRGEIFAIQDAVFNLAFIGGVSVAAAFVPPDGRGLSLVLAAAALYVTALIGVVRRRSTRVVTQ